MSHLPPPDKQAITIPLLQQWARDGRWLVRTTAYDAVTARLVDPVVDVILVGDSVGNVCLGFDNTLPASRARMPHHLKAVARTKPRALVGAGMTLIELADDVTLDEIKAKTEAEFRVALDGSQSNAA
ncbi:3-methyl-2-oxobutanoate hydroxymethyltransferase (plasmid) [Microvirga sp. VF16]|nr:3-methyl-2-oxobutanoate hydroxymethyltransferase [Microvirga sp. VF16]